MTRQYTFDEVKRMTGNQLLADLSITSTGVRRSFVVNGGDNWTAWMTMGRGKQHGKFYVHIETRMKIPVMGPDGKREGEIEDVMRFRGRPSQKIADFKPV